MPPFYPMSSPAEHHQTLAILAESLPAYDFGTCISEEGSGVRYEARHRSLERDVVFWLLPTRLGTDAGFRERFQEKARAMARLSHPSLIRIYDSGDLAGRLYTVTEHVRGESLRDCARGMAVDPRQAVGILVAAARGLAHAHENGVVHGDLRPAHLLITPKFEPKIGHFGLPRVAAGTQRVTEHPEYLPPGWNDGTHEAIPSDDVFSLGVILREMLTGIPAGSADAGRVHVSDARLAEICHRACHSDPASRYQDAASFAADLNQWLTSAESTVEPPRTPSMPRRPVPAMAAPLPVNAKPSAKRPTSRGLLSRIGLL